MYLITGGAGFIGSHLTAFLVAAGEQVRVLDNFATGKRENLAAISGKFELLEADIRDLEAIRGAFQGVEYVLHQAAIPSVPRSLADPLTTHAANVSGTMNVLLAAREAGVKRVVVASSSSVYGANPQLPKREDMVPQPLSPYAASKLATEGYAQAFYHAFGLETVCLRYFNVFGPHQDPTSQYAAVIPKFITAMLQGQRPTIYGDGEQTRDFTYVDNVVQANLQALRAEGVAGKVFNIACGRRISINELVATLNQLLGTDLEPLYAPPRPGEVKHSLADITAARQQLGYEPHIDFAEGLARTVEWYRRQLLG
jgi:nucleoside-diphosphate-sugar epimerase